MPSGVGRSGSAPAASSERTQRVQPERAAYKSAVNPPTGRYCARGSDVIWLSQSFADARASSYAYYAVTTRAARANPRVAAFVAWMMAEVQPQESES